MASDRKSSPLWERFLRHGSPVHLTGLQALARLPLEQVRRDRAAGRRVGAFVSGYPGSPLAGLDQTLHAIEPLLLEHDVRFQPAVNEELAAAAVAGSQLIDLFPHDAFDGVVGLWFGKAPGLDRSLDVLRHANFTGISRLGGALVVAGDDPACKSSSLPSQSEHAFAHARIPLLVPTAAADVVSTGLAGYALSRYAGLWVGLKLVSDVCDGGELVTLPERPASLREPELEFDGKPFEKRLDTRLLPPTVQLIERDLVFARLEAARRFVYENELDRIEHSGPDDRIGFVAAGHHYRDLLAALAQLGIGVGPGEGGLRSLAIRVYRPAMVYPLEPRRLREFAEGLGTLVVLDDRRDFLEQQVRDALYDLERRPVVLGQQDEAGRPWLTREGALDAEQLARCLGPALARLLERPQLAERAAALGRRASTPGPTGPARRPHFCSGCPHLTSTRVPDDLVAAGGIGCHTMVLLTEREMRFFGAMGSEGAHWNGIAPFVDTPHLLQNLGDGTYFHSGRQAIRACVEADVPITFKLLYNGAVAMTGGQRATGEKPPAHVIRDLLSDGVHKVAAMSDDPDVIALARSNEHVERVARDEIETAMLTLSREPGVTVLLYDELCANERQRRQRRGVMAAPGERIWIQRDVCEGCGSRSECLSLHPVATALGRKTTIHQGSCSQDTACRRGDCPAFLTLRADEAMTPIEAPADLVPPEHDPALPEIGQGFSLLMVGVGSTGVVTICAILMAAARREGLEAVHLDQTGLAQRGGRVVSHLRLRPGGTGDAIPQSAHVPWGGADSLLAFDPLGAAADDGLAYLSGERTHTVAHAWIAPTADMVVGGRDAATPSSYLATLSVHSRELHSLPAEPIASNVLGSHLAANVLLLGFAFEHGAIPLPSGAIEHAIRDHGVAIEANQRAFRLGRALAAHPDLVAPLLTACEPPSIGEQGSPERARALFGPLWQQIEDLVPDQLAPDSDAPLVRCIAGWACDLVDYQRQECGRHYLETLLPILRQEQAQSVELLRFSAVAARELYRLTAYKDEYEVARLHVRGPHRRWLDERAEGRVRPSYWLHPPVLRALGLRRKLRLGRWFEPVLRLLVALRWLRGTPFDPFGRAQVRRVERDLVRWYERVLAALADQLETVGVESATAIASRVADIRGYEEIKLARATAAREHVEKALTEHHVEW